MTATNDRQSDDAPLTTSKDPDRAKEAARDLVDAQGDTLVGKTVTINRPKQELYEFWRDFSNFPLFMDNVLSIVKLDETRWRWVVRAPADRKVEWTAVITEDRSGEVIAWTSEEGADVPNSGRIEFRDAPGGRGTWVTATILYDPPGGAIGKFIATTFQREPAIQARRDLRRFKQLMETGEIATSSRTHQQLDEEKA